MESPVPTARAAPPTVPKDEAVKRRSEAPSPEPPVAGIPAAKLAPMAVANSLPATNGSVQVIDREPFPQNLPGKLNIVLGQDGRAYSVQNVGGNSCVLPVGGKQLNNLIRKLGQEEGILTRRSDIIEINHYLQAHAESAGITRNIFYRVAPAKGGIEIDLCDDKHTRVRITPGRVEIVTTGSDTLFFRTRLCRRMAMPAEVGDLGLLKKYLNLHPVSVTLFIAWISYTLAHPKISTSKFVILIVRGNQGSGKTILCRIIKTLVDPSVIGVQMLPSSGRDLAIDAQSAHVLCYDNVRAFRHAIADLLCIAATGGVLTTRQLYSDADQQVHNLHVALVLNGIHSFIGQPDLAQRCLPIDLLPMPEGKRKSEAQFASELQADLPAIQRGLFDLIANILTHLPTAEVTNSERMIDFVHWLAAMERAQGAPAGVYQAEYSSALNQGQLDSILDDSLAAAIVDFVGAEVPKEWSDTPSALLAKLNLRASKGTQRSHDWPQNAIALSKKLIPLQASLLTQGIGVELGRGKERKITIKNEGYQSEKF